MRPALPPAGPLDAAPPATSAVRAWARANGIAVADRGRLRPEVVTAYLGAHCER